jgi:hypothetical protein
MRPTRVCKLRIRRHKFMSLEDAYEERNERTLKDWQNRRAARLSCLEKIQKMSFLERCQGRLDHETVLWLQEQGYDLKRKLDSRSQITRRSIPEMLKLDVPTVKLYMSNLIDIWNDYLQEKEYQWYLLRAASGPELSPPNPANSGKIAIGRQRVTTGKLGKSYKEAGVVEAPVSL